MNNLSPAEVERLVLLIEESGEIIQAATKILRHGYESTHPDKPHRTNRMDLEKEIGHFNIALVLMTQSIVEDGTIDLNLEHINNSEYEKSLSISKYLHHNHFY